MPVAAEEDRKCENYRVLIKDGHLFQKTAFEVQGAAGPRLEIYLNKLCKNLCSGISVPVPVLGVQFRFLAIWFRLRFLKL